jgi:hypothetical protein
VALDHFGRAGGAAGGGDDDCAHRDASGGATASGPTSSTRPLVVNQQAAALGEDLAPAVGVREQCRLREPLRFQRGVAERGGADEAGPGRLARRGVEQDLKVV